VKKSLSKLFTKKLRDSGKKENPLDLFFSEENEALKRKLTKKDIKPVPVRNRSTVKASVKDHTEADIEKEQELLRTLERIKKKLRRSITKKLQEEKQKK